MQARTTAAASTAVSSCLMRLLVSVTAVRAAVPGEKLLNVKGYGFDEYLVVGLACFVLFVAIKHLIFHTLYFWWFTHGRFYLPRAFRSLLTGKSLHERIYAHVAAAIKNSSAEGGAEKKLLLARDTIDHYCSQIEFAPNFGPHKAKLLTDAVKESTSKDEHGMLVVGSSYGYVILHLLLTSPSSHLRLLERDVAAAAHVIRLCDLIGVADKVKVICDDVPYEDLMERLGEDKFDLIFTTRHSHKQQSHLALVQKIEKQGLMKKGGVLFADKVVFFTDPPFLMHVRSDASRFSCTYHQMSLEHSSYDILDGCEVCRLEK